MSLSRRPLHVTRRIIRSVNSPETDLYLHAQTIRSVNRMVVPTIGGNIPYTTERGQVGRVRERFTDASGTRYQERVIADAESGRGRYTTTVEAPR